MTIKEVYQYITSLEPMERTHKLRSIKNKKEATDFKAANFDFCCFSGTFGRRKAESLIDLLPLPKRHAKKHNREYKADCKSDFLMLDYYELD